MLEFLHIQNYALIKDITIHFSSGLNILTGETGAGKSIIIGALQSILGERINSESVRTGTKKAQIEGQFVVPHDSEILSLLKESGIDCEDNSLIIKRIIDSNGKSTAFINNSAVTVSKLKEIGNMLVDIHGQYEHQYLLKVDNHLKILDKFGKLDEDIENFVFAYKKYRDVDEKLRLLKMKEEEKERTIEILKFAIQEIEKANLLIGEDSDLEEEIQKLSHKEKLFANIDFLYNVLYNNDKAVLSVLEDSLRTIQQVAEYDKSLSEVEEKLNNAKYEIEDVLIFLRKYKDEEFSIASLDDKIERLENIKLLKKKYGGSIEAVLKYKDKAEQELDDIEHKEETIKKLEQEKAILNQKLSQAALHLSGRRRVVGKILEEKMKQELNELGMAGAEFKVSFGKVEEQEGIIETENKRYKVYKNGIDVVEFLISTNKGEEAKPLKKIISGGELSRIMLALKNIFSKVDQIETMVFDEIDTGISGATALIVGQKMKEIAQTKQIFSITHLPQIAAKSDKHFVVYKKEEENKTITFVKELNKTEKVQEVARIMNGNEITDATLQHAKELIGENLEVQ